jgi:hypothetical protein
MTDDTDHDERETDEQAASLPLIDTFAALEAEIDAKSDRIERLESELDRGYLDSDGGTPGSADHADEEDADLDGVPRSHEDWEAATDPLEDTGAATDEGDHEGVTPTVESSGSEQEPPTGADSDDRTPPAESAGPQQSAEAEPEADRSLESGLSPVKTASSGESETASDEGSVDPDDGASATAEQGAESEEFGVTMDAASDLTGGSLGNSAGSTDSEGGNADAASEQDSPDAAQSEALPDPTADRGERLSLLVRRAELPDEDEVVEAFVRGIDGLDEVTREMLAHYREAGEAAPVDAHVAAGGSGKRGYAYARNRTLRKAGVIEHDGAGRYRYALPDLVAEAFEGNVADETVADAVEAIEAAADLD